MTTKMTSAWTSIGERRRRRKHTMTGKCLSSAWGHFRIVPIRSDVVATPLCHQGRVLAFSRHATSHELSSRLTALHIRATQSC